MTYGSGSEGYTSASRVRKVMDEFYGRPIESQTSAVFASIWSSRATVHLDVELPYIIGGGEDTLTAAGWWAYIKRLHGSTHNTSTKSAGGILSLPDPVWRNFVADHAALRVASSHNGGASDALQGKRVHEFLVATNLEMLSNPGFETAGGGGVDIWANWLEGAADGALANEVVIVHEGNDSAKITAGISANTYVRQNLATTPGTAYRVHFWTRGDGANAGRYYIYDVTNMEEIIPVTATGVTAAVWTSVVVNFTAPPGCVSIRLYFYAPPVNGGVAYFDACEVRGTHEFSADKYKRGQYRELLEAWGAAGSSAVGTS